MKEAAVLTISLTHAFTKMTALSVSGKQSVPCQWKSWTDGDCGLQDVGSLKCFCLMLRKKQHDEIRSQAHTHIMWSKAITKKPVQPVQRNVVEKHFKLVSAVLALEQAAVLLYHTTWYQKTEKQTSPVMPSLRSTEDAPCGAFQPHLVYTWFDLCLFSGDRFGGQDESETLLAEWMACLLANSKPIKILLFFPLGPELSCLALSQDSGEPQLHSSSLFLSLICLFQKNHRDAPSFASFCWESLLGPLLGPSISISLQEESPRIFHRASLKSMRNWEGRWRRQWFSSKF